MVSQKALLVGINLYKPPGGPNLNGCVNDVNLMAKTLSQHKIVPITPANMHFLTNDKATRANILKELQWLVAGAKPGDVLIFHYSGHGSQVVDIHGELEELDKKDETICPHDYAAAGMIEDDDLRKIFSVLPSGEPAVNLEVFLDSCHSGTGTRLILNEPEGLIIRSAQLPFEETFFLDAYPDLPVQGLMKWERPAAGKRAAVEVPKLNHVLWAGCKDNQLSGEKPFAGKYQGVFTYYFCTTLNKTGINITRRKLDSLVSSAIGGSQTPQLEGTKKSLDQKVFT